MLEWATFLMATIAAVDSVVRVAQNERSHQHALLHLGQCLGCRRTPLPPFPPRSA
jgi:hypothetical protein